MTPSPPAAHHRRDPQGWRPRFIEELSGLSVTPEASPAAMRVLAWMAVCEPREQSARQIQDQLGLSAGTVSSAVRMLAQIGVIERAAHTGTRRVFYCFADRGWQHLLEARLQTLSQLRPAMAARAVDSAGEGADARLTELRDTARAMEEGLALLLRSRHDEDADMAPTAPRGAMPLGRSV